MDAMASVSMPASQIEVRADDFIAWVDRYIRFPSGARISGNRRLPASAELTSTGTDARCLPLTLRERLARELCDGWTSSIGHARPRAPEGHAAREWTRVDERVDRATFG